MKVILTVLALLIFTNISLYAQESCVFCHADSAYTVIYDSSSHGGKNISCDECHVEAHGLFTFFKKRYTDLLTFSSKNAHPAHSAKSENCQACHRATNQFNVVAEDALPEDLKTIGLVFDHKLHTELRDSCMTCHQQGKFKDNKILSQIGRDDPMGCASCHLNIVHESPVKYGYPIPKETDCANCHSSKNKCPSMKKISDIKDEKRCTECHPNQYSF